MKVYKVLKRKCSRLYSCCGNSNFPPQAQVEYKVGEYVKPNESLKDSLLFAFRSLEEAKDFANTLYDYDIKVYEADAIGVTKACYPQNIHWGIDYYINYWSDFNKARKLRKKLPKGQAQKFVINYKTGVCCREIKLVKEIV